MANKICPKCNRIMSYDPYFKANICRQCGATESVGVLELTSRKIINSRVDIIKKRLTLARY